MIINEMQGNPCKTSLIVNKMPLLLITVRLMSLKYVLIKPFRMLIYKQIENSGL